MISREEGELDLVIEEEDMMAVRYRETDAQEQEWPTYQESGTKDILR